MQSQRPYTREELKKILTYIREGATQNTAVSLVGRSPIGFVQFKRCSNPIDGLDDFGYPLQGDDRRCNNCRGCAVHAEVVRQENLFKMEALGHVRNATFMGNPDWKAQAFLLERRFPDEFGELIKQDITSTHNVAIQNARSVVDAIVGRVTELDRQPDSVSRGLLREATAS